MSRQVKEASVQYSISRHSREGGNSVAVGVPPGYKQTKVGLIPEDWSVKKISELSVVIKGGKSSSKGR